MIYKVMCAAGAGVLLSASIVMAIPRGVVSGATSAAATAPIEVAGKHSSSSSSSGRSSSSSGRSFSSGGRSFVSGRSGANAVPAHRPQVAAPFKTYSAPRVTTGTAFYGRPRGRFARRLLPLAALGTIYIGSRYYYPYRYLPYDGPVCSGVTANGCELRWMDVPTEDGDETALQCVEFCPQD